MVLSRKSKTHNALIPLGITSMSAVQKLGGGICKRNKGEDQFKVRIITAKVSDFLISLGYEPVWKDWEKVLSLKD